MAGRCEDFPCCGHYDPGGSSWCPDDEGWYPCSGCGIRLNEDIMVRGSSMCRGCYSRMQRAWDEDGPWDDYYPIDDYYPNDDGCLDHGDPDCPSCDEDNW